MNNSYSNTYSVLYLLYHKWRRFDLRGVRARRDAESIEGCVTAGGTQTERERVPEVVLLAEFVQEALRDR